MKILKVAKNNQSEVVKQAMATLKQGGLVVFPSDTVYGLLVDSTNPKAVDKLLAFKERRPGQAISVFVGNKKQAEKYVVVNQNAKNIINNLLPGPFTVICQSKHLTDPRLQAENKTLGFRIPDFPLINKLVEQFGKPLTATSANLSSQSPHYSIASFLKAISEKKKSMIDLIVDQGILVKHKPSTVIDTTSGELKTLRLGDLFPTSFNILISKSEKQTIELGRFLATKFINKTTSKPLIFLLQGELGTGKTILTKGIGKALNIKQEIVSPTYTISYEYLSPITKKTLIEMTSSDINNHYQSNIKDINNNVKLVHYDLYRFETIDDLKEIDLVKNLVCGNIYVIEWPERIQKELISALQNSAEIVYVTLKHLAENEKNNKLKKNYREIKWTSI